MTLPDESFGEAVDRIRDNIEALPWYAWLFKVHLHWRLKVMEALVAAARDEGLRRYFAS